MATRENAMTQDNDATTTTSLTWADYHPEVFEAFEHVVPWPYEKVTTELGPCSQPTVAKGPDEELVVEGLRACAIENASNDADRTASVYHSTDGGLTWATLCRVPLACEVDMVAGHRTIGPEVQGVGMLGDGTLLVSFRFWSGLGPPGPENETVCSRVWVARSGDRGRTWDAPCELDPSPYECMGGNKVRFHQLPDGTVLLPMNCTRYARPGRPLPPGQAVEIAHVYASNDSGRTWRKHGDVNVHSDETDFLPLPSGRILAATRYQRKKLPDDPADLITPYYIDPEHRRTRPDCHQCDDPRKVDGHSAYKQMAICHSDDGGRTFSEHLILTGWVQQTGCLIGTSDGTVVMPFGHKIAPYGQRFMVSYDQGRTWSKTVFELNKSGHYASSVVLSDDTIVTVFAHGSNLGGQNRLEALRWKLPPSGVVASNGFFAPRPAAFNSQD